MLLPWAAAGVAAVPAADTYGAGGGSLASSSSGYTQLQHVALRGGATGVSTLLQDAEGLVWIGTERGLQSYDGYLAYEYRPGGKPAAAVRCGVVANSVTLYFGTERGLLCYDLKGEAFGTVPAALAEADVHALALVADTLWAGTAEGLSRFAVGGGKVLPVGGELGTRPVRCLLEGADSCLYAGTADGLLRLDHRTGVLAPVVLPAGLGAVGALCADVHDEVLWVGTEAGLLRCPLGADTLTDAVWLRGNTVTSLAYDAQERLVAGTDNGLYVLRREASDAPLHIMRDARDASSLPSDAVQCVWRDRDGDMWFGTSDGLAMFPQDADAPFTPIWQVTGLGRGNRFTCIVGDSQGELWLGGTNGLLRTVPTLDDPDALRWYRADDARWHLAGNMVWQVYEDADGDRWAVTSGGIHLLQPDGTMRYLTVSDTAGLATSRQASALCVDAARRCWIATAKDGVLMVDKQTLVRTRPGADCLAAACVDTACGLASMSVTHVVAGDAGSVWVLPSQGGIQRIGADSLTVTGVPLPAGTGSPSCLMRDAEDRVWAGVAGGAVCWDLAGPSAGEPQVYAFAGSGGSLTTSMARVGREVWAVTGEGVWMIDVETGAVRRLRDLGHEYGCVGYAAALDRVYLGGQDGLTHERPALLVRPAGQRPVQLVAIDINGQTVYSNGWKGLRQAEYLGFGYAQNHLVFHFSDYPYSRLLRDRLFYRLLKGDGQWHPLPPGAGSVELSALKPANYRIEVSRMGNDGRLMEPLSIPFKVYPPWYKSWWAILAYTLLALALAYFVLRFLLMRTRLGVERRERDHVVDQTRRQMRLYAEMSGEVMGPVSGIVRPLGQLAQSPDLTPGQQPLVAEAQRNAQQLSDMVRRLMDHDRLDVSSTMMLTEVDVAALVRDVYEGYRDGAFARNDISSEFVYAGERLVQLADRIKLVSAVTNLLSNAARFTPRGGKVTVSLEAEGAWIVIRVADNGIGIPDADLPNVGQRHFQASNVRHRRRKDGMGLYLARLYTEMHGGSFDIASTLGQGTTVTLTLPRGAGVDDYARSGLTAEDYLERIVDDKEVLSEYRRKLPSPYGRR